MGIDSRGNKPIAIVQPSAGDFFNLNLIRADGWTEVESPGIRLAFHQIRQAQKKPGPEQRRAGLRILDCIQNFKQRAGVGIIAR